MFSHILRDRAKTDGGEVVDRETSVLGVVQGEHATARHPDLGILEALCDGLETHALRDLVEQDLDEDTGTRGCFLLSELDAVEDVPRDGIRRDEVSEEPRDVPETVRFVSVDGLVVLTERLLEAIEPNTVQPAKAFSDEPVERRIRPLLRTTLYDHLAELDLV